MVITCCLVPTAQIFDEGAEKAKRRLKGKSKEEYVRWKRNKSKSEGKGSKSKKDKSKSKKKKSKKEKRAQLKSVEALMAYDSRDELEEEDDLDLPKKEAVAPEMRIDLTEEPSLAEPNPATADQTPIKIFRAICVLLFAGYDAGPVDPAGEPQYTPRRS